MSAFSYAFSQNRSDPMPTTNFVCSFAGVATEATVARRIAICKVSTEASQLSFFRGAEAVESIVSISRVFYDFP